MRIEPYLEHIPEIENRIRRLQPDAIVIGLGPSAHLLPWINQKLLQEPRRFGVHDVFRIIPVDDLVIMDPPRHALHEETARFKTIIESRPKRWWFYPTAWSNPDLEAATGIPFWHKHLPQCVRDSVKVQEWTNFEPQRWPMKTLPDGSKVPDKDLIALDGPLPITTSMSPVGATTLAWHLGCRRIGVIGLDAIQADHPSSLLVQPVTMVMKHLARRAEQAGGAIWQLSPFSAINRFDPPSTSGSGPTSGNAPQGPSGSLSTASAAEQPAR